MGNKCHSKTMNFFDLFTGFINESTRGKRLQPNGKRLSVGTLSNYMYTLKLIKRFSDAKGFKLRIRDGFRLNKRERESERNYWKRFYKYFANYFYYDLGHFDNYVGHP
jgi:hypothetical protein